jgi:DNA-binding NarL/FixJ family response regulator
VTVAEKAARVAVVDPREMHRLGVAEAMRVAEGCALVLAVATGDALLAALRQGAAVDVVLVHLPANDLEGFTILGLLHTRYPAVRVLAVCAHATKETVARAILLHVLGVVQEDVSVADLRAALDDVKAGRFHMNALGKELLKLRAQQVAQRGAQRPLLSDRELETLKWKAAHYSESGVARKMHVKTSTVHTNMKHVREKLHVRSGVAAVRRAQRMGLLPRA